MATAREENPYEGGGGGFGKFRKRPLRRPQTTPYDRPPTALRNPTRDNSGWFSKLVDPAQRLIASSAHRLFSSVFRKRLPAPPSPTPPSPEAVQEVRENHQEAAVFVANDSSSKQQGAVDEMDVRINCSGDGGLTELEKLLKQKTFTREEIDHLTALMHSRTADSPVGEEGKRSVVVVSDSMLPRDQKEDYPNTPALKNGIENCVVSTPFVTSSVPMEGVASPAELAKAYMGSRPSKVSPSMLSLQSPIREDPTQLKGQHFTSKSPTISFRPRDTSLARIQENGFMTPRSRGRSAIYSMARTPYARVYPASRLKGVGVADEGDPSSSAQYAVNHDMLSGSKQGALKRRSSVLDNDIGCIGPIRRIRQKSNLLSSKGLTLPDSGSPLSIARSRVGVDASQKPSSSMQKPIQFGEVKHSHLKLSAENVDDTIPSTSFPPLPSKSTEMASKILQQLDKLVSPKEKSSELKLPTLDDKSPTKLSASMLQGKALRSIETVDSSKFLDNIRDNEFDGMLGNSTAAAQKLKSQTDEVENGPLKLLAPTAGLASVDADATVPMKQDMYTVKSRDSSMTKPASYPQKKRAFHMSAHEDYLELDDDVYPNGAVSPFSNSGKGEATIAADKTASSTETTQQEKPPGSSVVMPSKNFTLDAKPHAGIVDGSAVSQKVDVLTPTTSSVADSTFKPITVTAATQTILGSDKSPSPNGSVANPPLFTFENKVVPSTELTAADAPSKEFTKSGPIFGFEKVVSSKEPGADALNSSINKNVDNASQVPFSISSSVGGESASLKFGALSDSKLRNSISSTAFAGAVDSTPKVLESHNADVKTNMFTGLSAQSSEPAVSAAGLAPLSTSPPNIFTFGKSSNQNNGPVASSPSFSSMVTNNFTSQNMSSSSPLAASSSRYTSATVAPSSAGMTASTPAVIASSNSSSSTQVVVSSSSTTSFSTFGSTPLLSTGLPVSSSSASESVETKSMLDAGTGNLGSTSFGSSSAAVGSTVSGIFGFSSPAMTTVNSQLQGSVFGTSGPQSGLGTMGPLATSSSATTSQSQSVAFGSSASSPLFGLTGNTALSSGSSAFPSSSPTTSIFNSGTTFGQSTVASTSEANSVGSNGGTSSTVYGLTSWQPSKSPFGSSFSSSSSSSAGFAFGASTPSSSSGFAFGASTPSPSPGFSFGASTPSSSSGFSFGTLNPSSSSGLSFGTSTTSLASTSSPMMFGSSTVGLYMQPSFGSPSPVFPFGSAPVNNDQMSTEDSMAEDVVQTNPPVTPVFGQPPAPLQSNFVFGSSTPTQTPTPTGASPFQFTGQQNIAPQNPSPFQASGSLEFNSGGSFSLGPGGDKTGRKIVRINKNRLRKK